MSSRYTRPASPMDRRTRDPYKSAKAGGERVIPISTHTFVNGVEVSGSRLGGGYDQYSDIGRRTSTIPSDVADRRHSTAVGASARGAKGAVVHNGNGRSSSPSRTTNSRYDAPYYVTPASSATSKREHKKVYAIDGGRTTRLVDDGSRGVRRRDSAEMVAPRDAATAAESRRRYHLSGPVPRSSTSDDYGGYEYTDARGMYRDTEPRVRNRRGSVDLSNGDRRASQVDGYAPARSGVREAGPPPVTRGLDKINSGVTRHASLRDTPRSPQYRDRAYGSYSEESAYSVPAGIVPAGMNPALYERPQPFVPVRDDFEDKVEVRRTNGKFQDHDVANRGFGIRQDPDVPNRGFGIRTGNVDIPYPGEEPRSVYGSETVPRAPRRDFVEPPQELPRGERRRDAEIRERIVEPPQDLPRVERRRDLEVRERDHVPERERVVPRERDREAPRERHRDAPRDRERDYEDDSRLRDRDYVRERERDRYEDDDRKVRDKRVERDGHGDRRDRDRDDRRHRDDDHMTPEVLAALAGGTAAIGAAGFLGRDRERVKDRDSQDHEKRGKDRDSQDHEKRGKDRDSQDHEKRGKDRDAQDYEKRSKDREAQDHEKRVERDGHGERREREREEKRNRDDTNVVPEVMAPVPGVAATYGAGELNDRRERNAQELEDRDRRERKAVSPDDNAPRERHYVTKDDRRDKPDDQEAAPLIFDPDEDYRRRVQLEMERVKQARAEDKPGQDHVAEELRRRPRDSRGTREQEDTRHSHQEETRGPNEPDLETDGEADSQALTQYGRHDSIFDGPLVEEPGELSENRDNRVRIVEPPKEKEKEIPKGILRRPTEKFPEDPNPIREGVAPLKDATKKGVPPGARWTKIDRRLVNPEALEAAKERFEERQDCVIVLRVLTKEEIQKFADRTTEIRDRRYERDHRERRRRRDGGKREHDGADDDDDDDDDEGEGKAKQITWNS